MSKIEELEKRIEELEKKLFGNDSFPNNINWDELKDSLGELVTKSDGAFKRTFLNKYSEKNLPAESKHLCIEKAIEKVKGRNCAVKLKHWKEYKIALGNRKNVHWMNLQYFVDKAIKYYEQDVIKYILKEGKYVDYGGPREQIKEKETVYNYYLHLKKNHPELFYSTGRHKGRPIKDKIEPLLREKIGKSDFDSMRSIWNYIREREK